jgi:hypothetical protein
MGGVGSHPVNLAFRFGLELCLLGTLGYYGYRLEHPVWRWVAMIGLPLTVAILWGVFAVPDDPSRSGKTIVATPGAVRLMLELLLFALGVAACVHRGWYAVGITFGVVVVLHYLVSYDRVQWLLSH